MKRSWVGRIRILLIAAAFAALLYGIFRGEIGIILQKAAAICLECIGIG